MGNATVTEIIGLATTITIVGLISVAILNGGNTAKVVGSFGSAFQGSLGTALRGGNKAR
jgi:Flp pilus assembly pilin Flp